MSRGSKGKAKQNGGSGNGKGGGKNGGSPGSRAQQTARSSGGNGSKPAKWRTKPVPPGTKRCSHCGGNVTPGNRAKHERRDASGMLFHPCAPTPLAELPPDPEPIVQESLPTPPLWAPKPKSVSTQAPPKPTMQPPPKPVEPPKPTKKVGRWTGPNKWACETSGCNKTDCFANEANCYGGCGTERPPMDRQPAASAGFLA